MASLRCTTSTMRVISANWRCKTWIGRNYSHGCTLLNNKNTFHVQCHVQEFKELFITLNLTRDVYIMLYMYDPWSEHVHLTVCCDGRHSDRLQHIKDYSKILLISAGMPVTDWSSVDDVYLCSLLSYYTPPPTWSYFMQSRYLNFYCRRPRRCNFHENKSSHAVDGWSSRLNQCTKINKLRMIFIELFEVQLRHQVNKLPKKFFMKQDLRGQRVL